MPATHANSFTTPFYCNLCFSFRSFFPLAFSPFLFENKVSQDHVKHKLQPTEISNVNHYHRQHRCSNFRLSKKSFVEIYYYSKTNNKPTLILLPAWVYFLVARWYDLCWIQQSAILSSNLFRSSGSEPLGSVIFSANSSVMITLWDMHRSKASEN